MKANGLGQLHALSGSTIASRTPSSVRLARAACLLGGALALSATCFGQATESTISDAQVEANVLKALSSAPELATEDIHTRTVYGVVSLSGTVRNEALRLQVENLAANSNGVQKVVDELQLGDASTATSVSATASSIPQTQSQTQSSPSASSGPGQQARQDVSQSDPSGHPAPGSAPAATSVMNDPAQDQQHNSNSAAADVQPQNQQPQYGPPPSGYPAPQEGSVRRPIRPGADYPDPGYEGAPEYGRQQPPPHDQAGRRADRYPSGGYEQRSYGGQTAGQSVVVPSGTILRVRLNQAVSSDHSVPGSSFEGVVESDVSAGGAVAIPRGAQVHGTVVAAAKAGVLKGRGDLTIALTSVTLGGREYPLVTAPWEHHGGDKTIETVNKTAGFGAVGAVVGALAGGGEGAAIGGGIGAAAGLGSSATSGRGQVFLPAEAVVTFSLSMETPVTTVSEQEMQRLAYGAAPAPRPRYPRRRAYPPVYVGPGYYPYPGYYPPPPYGYPPY